MIRPSITATFVFLFILQDVSAFSPSVQENVVRSSEMKLFAQQPINRRAILGNVAAIATAAAMLSTEPSFALNSVPADNEIVKEQRQVVTKLDINNSPVADYMQLPGMYPKIGGKIANNGPYKSVQDVYKLQGLSDNEKNTIKKYESELTATASKGFDTLRGRDPYRSSFNKMAYLQSE